jgi:hypothetical protein
MIFNKLWIATNTYKNMDDETPSSTTTTTTRKKSGKKLLTIWSPLDETWRWRLARMLHSLDLTHHFQRPYLRVR